MEGFTVRMIFRDLVHGWVIYAMFSFFLGRGYSIAAPRLSLMLC